MDWSGCEVVERVPGKLGGAPVLRHSRMRADWVFENYLSGMTSEEQVEQYVGLNLGDIEAVIHYAVRKYIETRELEDTVRSEHAMGAARAA